MLARALDKAHGGFTKRLKGLASNPARVLTASNPGQVLAAWPHLQSEQILAAWMSHRDAVGISRRYEEAGQLPGQPGIRARTGGSRQSPMLQAGESISATQSCLAPTCGLAQIWQLDTTDNEGAKGPWAHPVQPGPVPTTSSQQGFVCPRGSPWMELPHHSRCPVAVLHHPGPGFLWFDKNPQFSV